MAVFSRCLTFWKASSIVRFVPVPNYIRRFREAHGLTAAELAAKVGVTASAVSKWESGAREVSDDLKIELARFFNVPVSALFDFEYQPLADALRRTIDVVSSLKMRLDAVESELEARSREGAVAS